MKQLYKLFVVLFLNLILDIFDTAQCYKLEIEEPEIIYRSENLNENYLVEWAADMEKSLIQFTVTVKTQGFIGFGISYTGGMKDADIFIGGVLPNGETYFSDRHAIGNAEPIIDDQQDWNLIDGKENETHTVLTFTRLFDTCDSQDIIINEDTLKIIWSYGETDDLAYHGVHRGTLAVNFLDPQIEHPDLSPYKTWTISQEVSLPPVDTTYWCTFFRAPNLTQKHHVIGFDLHTDGDKSRKHTHHADVMKCTAPEGEDPEEFFSKYLGYGFDCYYSQEYFPVEHCQVFEYQWSIGGKITIFPDHLGVPIGENPIEFFMTEVHYDNPDSLGDLKVHSGMQFYYTDQLRPVDAGFMFIGSTTSKLYSLTIPPNSVDFIQSHHCSSKCTNNLPSDGLNAFVYLLHSHLSGRKQKVRLFRDGIELPWLANDEHYDFNYQTNRKLRHEVKILPGDHFTLECTYDTNWKNGGSTTAGRSPREEMCQVFIMYYPRFEPINLCGSYFPQKDMLKLVGIDNVTSVQGEMDPTVISPDHLAGKRYSQVIEEIDWTDERRKEFQEITRFSPQEAFCDPQYIDEDFGFATYPEILQEYIPPNVCNV